MPSNIEIKAKVREFNAAKATAESISDGSPVTIAQEDVFFHVPHGRLKLRIFEGNRGELIQYQRSDTAGPKLSDYRLAPTADAAMLREVLSAALGVKAIVRKERLLYMSGQTRIHLDRVEDLGDFVELEVVLQPGQSPEDGQAIAHCLMQRLEIHASELIRGAYVDLLMAAHARQPSRQDR